MTDSTLRLHLLNRRDSKVIRSNVAKHDKRICSFIVFCTICLFLVNISYLIETFTGIPYKAISNALKVLIGIVFVFITPSIIRNLNLRFIPICISLLLLFVLNYFAFPETRYVFNSTFLTFWTNCFIFIISVCSVKDYGLLIKKYETMTKYLAYACLAISTINVFHGFRADISYNMGFGYSCLLPCLFSCKMMLDKVTLRSLIRFVVFLLSIILIGSRGPLLSIAVFFLCYSVIKLLDKQQIKNKTALCVLIAGVIICLILYRHLFEIIDSTFEQMGVESRTIKLLINNPFHNSGRTDLQNEIIFYIKKSPFSIRGINSDYLILDIYTHNIILELLYEFGILLGGLFLLLILTLALKTFIRKKHDEYSRLLVVLFCVSVPCLMVSSSVWTDSYFWMWLSLCLIGKNTIKNIQY